MREESAGERKRKSVQQEKRSSECRSPCRLSQQRKSQEKRVRVSSKRAGKKEVKRVQKLPETPENRENESMRVTQEN